MLSSLRPRFFLSSCVRLHPPAIDSLTAFDPEIYALNQLTIFHQIQSLDLGESDSFASPSTLRAVTSFSRDSPATSSTSRRILNELQHLCRDRSLEAFGLDAREWSVSVRPPPAAVAVAGALLPANGGVIGLRGKWQSIDRAHSIGAPL